MIALAKRTMRAPSAVSTRTVLGEVNCALAGDHRHLALAGEAGEAGRQALDDAVLPVADRGEIDRRRAEADAVRRHRRGVVDGLGDMQERLRGNAADVEADAAERRPRGRPARPSARDRRRGRRRCSRRGRRRARGGRPRSRPARRVGRGFGGGPAGAAALGAAPGSRGAPAGGAAAGASPLGIGREQARPGSPCRRP